MPNTLEPSMMPHGPAGIRLITSTLLVGVTLGATCSTPSFQVVLSSTELWSVSQTSDGGFIAAGRGSDPVTGISGANLVKLDPLGDVVWQRYFAGTSDQTAYAQAVLQTSDGGYVLSGHTSGPSPAASFVVKTDSGGTLAWQHDFPTNQTAAAITAVPGGGYVIVGQTYVPPTTPYQPYIAALDADGNLVSQREIALAGFYGTAVQPTSDGGFIVTCTNGYYSYIVKTDSTGADLWHKLFLQGIFRSVQQMPDGQYVIAGGYSYANGTQDALLLRVDGSGNIVWQHTYGGSQDDSAYAFDRTSDGGFALAGKTKSIGAGNYDVYLIKTDSSGTLEWQTTYGQDRSDIAYDIDATNDGGYVLAGSTQSFTDPGTTKGYIIKTDASGAAPAGP